MARTPKLKDVVQKRNLAMSMRDTVNHMSTALKIWFAGKKIAT